MDVLLRLTMLGGVARRSELARDAADRRAVRHHLAVGTLRDAGGGWLAAQDADPALVVARRSRGAVSCVSVAPFYGISLLHPPEGVHLAVPRTRGRRPTDGRVRLHRESGWTEPGRLAVVPIAEALARVLRCRPAAEAIVAIDSALNKRLTTAEQIERLLVGPGSPHARATLGRCDSRSRSPIETSARLALVDAGLGVEAGVSVPGVGEVDLVVEGHVVVECDGFAYHSGRHEYREDRRRDRALVALGFIVLRFTWEEVTADPACVPRAVLAALHRR